ncbi:MAG TPA: HAD family hydrolase [Fimbriimonadaceae bacterium]|nr:HAD family hydrolase [Fimbriimonadaceae bacterium]
MRKPLFLDRDGVLNVDVTPYVSRIEQLEIFPYTAEALRLLNQAGFDLFVVSNQQGVSKGITPPEELSKMTEALQDVCREQGFEIRKFYYCTALKGEDHSWRKPAPGMIMAARDEFNLDLNGAFLIGDKWSDIEAGARAGLRTLLVYSGVTAPGEETNWKHQPESAFPTVLEAAQWIVGEGRS